MWLEGHKLSNNKDRGEQAKPLHHQCGQRVINLAITKENLNRTSYQIKPKPIQKEKQIFNNTKRTFSCDITQYIKSSQ